MSSLYELYSKRTKYRALRENVSNAINVLSRVGINDGLATAVYTLSSNYLVNDAACKRNSLNKVKESLATDLSNLNVCLSSINAKISSLTKEIEELEAAGTG